MLTKSQKRTIRFAADLSMSARFTLVSSVSQERNTRIEERQVSIGNH